jgi:CRISPR-associated protein Cas5d
MTYRPNHPPYKHVERVVMQIQGDFAQFCPPHCSVERISYPCPTPTAGAGIGHTIYHTAAILPVLRKVEVLRPLQQARVPQHMHRASSIGARSVTKKAGQGGGAMIEPRGSLYLRDVEYRMHFNVHAYDAQRVRRFRRLISNQAFSGGIFLGVRECMGFLVSVDDRPPAPVNTIEPYFPIGAQYTCIEIVEGVVEFPDWTKAALEHWFHHVRGKEMAA